MAGAETQSRAPTLSVAVGLVRDCRSLLASGDAEGALASAEEALRIRRSILGDGALKVANTRHLVGEALLGAAAEAAVRGATAPSGTGALSMTERAAEQLSEALSVRRRKLGDGHVDAAETAHLLGVALVSCGREREGLDSLHFALSVRSAVFGVEHETVARTLGVLGDAYLKVGEHCRAVQAHAYALDVKLTLHGENSVEVAYSHLALARAFSQACDHEMALHHAARGVAMLKDVCGPEDGKVGVGLIHLGLCHHCNGDSEVAVGELLDAVSILSSSKEFKSAGVGVWVACSALALVRWVSQEYELAVIAMGVIAAGGCCPDGPLGLADGGATTLTIMLASLSGSEKNTGDCITIPASHVKQWLSFILLQGEDCRSDFVAWLEQEQQTGEGINIRAAAAAERFIQLLQSMPQGAFGTAQLSLLQDFARFGGSPYCGEHAALARRLQVQPFAAAAR